MEIKIPKQQMISTGNIIIDDSNPNKMSKSSFEALKRNMQKFGFLIPIITNKNFKIADGYHRWKAARELGQTEVPVIALDLDEVDRRMLRQILNKLRGEHDQDMDKDEFKFFYENDSLDEFMNLIDQNIDLKEVEGYLKDFNYTEKEYDETIKTDNECPKCQYKW